MNLVPLFNLKAIAGKHDWKKYFNEDLLFLDQNKKLIASW